MKHFKKVLILLAIVSFGLNGFAQDESVEGDSSETMYQGLSDDGMGDQEVAPEPVQAKKKVKKSKVTKKKVKTDKKKKPTKRVKDTKKKKTNIE